ncbi:MAG: N-6 DNA methylase [Ignavibacteriaceae bacterium]|nr:N-6 DNA methylase [Ignavibacteriaceae bacterium]
MLNERAWSGQIISWIKESINNGTSIFQDATNDEGIKVESGSTKFPDVLLFLDKIAGIVFNGWELKYPDTAVDDREMLVNALEKAKQLRSNSFVTWNGSSAIIWLINDENYNIASLSKLKIYPKEEGISSRNDLADRQNYNQHEPKLRARLAEILHDLEQLYRVGKIREALNISSNIVGAIANVAEQIIPLLRNALFDKINDDETFQNQFGVWKILESSTLKILSSSSHRVERIDPIMVLAKFTYYKLIGKILFYKTLSENLSDRVTPLNLIQNTPVKQQLEAFFQQAKQIDYQAVFDRDFTDELDFDANIDRLLYALLNVFSEIDFRYLPNEVIGFILENLVPKNEKRKFGQYFTSETLAYLVSMSALRTRDTIVFDPTSGSGTFLTAFYNILKYRGIANHQQLLNQVWGNDISHFPAVLSVINLYKQDLVEQNNFPRVTRHDYFQLSPGQEMIYPDPVNERSFINVALPQFNAIISNFPFIQQEDIPNKYLSDKFRQEFQRNQLAFVNGRQFKINERSDYFTYCFYNSLKFLNTNGYIAAITSNAWLGKNYGIQFKRFLIDNFSIRYIFRSNAEHWFRDSKVSTIFTTVQRTIDDSPTRFVTLNIKLEDYFTDETKNQHISMMEELYNEINYCELPTNNNWTRDAQFTSVFHKNDGKISVSIVERAYLEQQIISQENWAINFLAQDPLQQFRANLINPFPTILDAGRGTRTGWDSMHILKQEDADQNGIDNEFLLPVLKTSQDLSSIHYNSTNDSFLFVCNRPLDEIQHNFPNTFRWIQRWSNETNNTGVPLPNVLQNRHPYWYSLNPEEPANIFISINPNDKLFFAYCDESIYLNQRLVAIRVPSEQVNIVAAILNSIVSLLFVELNGVSRNLGVLDLNADFFQSKMRILNPALLSDEAKERIITAFNTLAIRNVQNYDIEYQQVDRIQFDNTVLHEFGYEINILPRLYDILTQSIRDRIEMKDR